MADNICFLLFMALLISAVNTKPPPPNTICYEILEESNPDNSVEKRQVDCSSMLREASDDESPANPQKTVPLRRRPPILSEEEKKKKQARAFEGLLHLATVVNHIDTFLMDKGKLFLKSLGKMVASEEDTRFDI